MILTYSVSAPTSPSIAIASSPPTLPRIWSLADILGFERMSLIKHQYKDVAREGQRQLTLTKAQKIEAALQMLSTVLRGDQDIRIWRLKVSMCSRNLRKQINGESVCLQSRMPKDIAGEKNENKKNIPLCIYSPGCLPSLESRSLTPSHRESRAVVISNVLLHSVLLAYNMKHCNKESVWKDRTAD